MSFTLSISGFCLIDKSSIIHLFLILKQDNVQLFHLEGIFPTWAELVAGNGLGTTFCCRSIHIYIFPKPSVAQGVEEHDSNKAKRNTVTSPAQWERGRAGDRVRYLGSDVTFPHFSIQKRRRPLDPRKAAKPS